MEKMPGMGKVGKVMGEYKAGTLMSGSGGKVKSRKQAVVIALNEARKAGGNIPKRAGSPEIDHAKMAEKGKRMMDMGKRLMARGEAMMKKHMAMMNAK